MRKLIAKIYELRKQHGHPCILELIKMIENGGWFMRLFVKTIKKK